ncbi:MAG: FAD-linked oxidase C-terminal domain-containing protein, partial [Acidobacteriota bacterium]
LKLVEFFEDVEDRLAQLAKMDLGDRTIVCANDAEQELVWELRRSGLSLVTSCIGAAKPAPAVEDACVRPEDLPAFVEGMQAIIGDDVGASSFYGHAASGLLHIRPILDLHAQNDIARLREVAEAVSSLVRRFGGSIAGEHGVGIARTEFLPEHLGLELIELSAEVKRIFDPAGVLNPGKIVDTERWRVDRDLRQGPGSSIDLPFIPISAFVEKDRSFVGNLEQCNGCGGCRKDSPTMCPTYAATGDEVLSTRGRANVLRAALEGRLDDGISGPDLAEALGSCLSCKACKRECPSGVDLALLKAESIQARHRIQGPSLADRVIGASDLLGRLGSATAPLSNVVLGSGLVRGLMERMLGIDSNRSLPPFSRERFDRWFDRRPGETAGDRGRVILWDDTWVRYHEPSVGRAAVEVLEAAGYEVVLAEGRRCCGRPAASRGLLEQARDLGRHNVALLRSMGEAPIIFLEPSCWSIFVDEYRQFEIEGAEEIAARCVLFEDFVSGLLDADPESLPFRALETQTAIHGHCHTKALADPAIVERLLRHVPGLDARHLETGRCGMAGAFGMMAANQELSRAVAEPLVQQMAPLSSEAIVVAAGTSCRHQVRDLTGRDCLHPAEVLAASMTGR